MRPSFPAECSGVRFTTYVKNTRPRSAGDGQKRINNGQCYLPSLGSAYVCHLVFVAVPVEHAVPGLSA